MTRETETTVPTPRRTLRRNAGVAFFAAIAGALTVYYCVLHSKPFTQNAFLVANIRPVSPLVEGYVTSIRVRNHQFVRRGEELFTTFRVPYELKVAELAHAVSEKEAVRDALDAELAAAGAELKRTEAEAANREFLAAQAAEMYGSGAVSQTYAEETRRAAEAGDR